MTKRTLKSWKLLQKGSITLLTLERYFKNKIFGKIYFISVSVLLFDLSKKKRNIQVAFSRRFFSFNFRMYVFHVYKHRTIYISGAIKQHKEESVRRLGVQRQTLIFFISSESCACVVQIQSRPIFMFTHTESIPVCMASSSFVAPPTTFRLDQNQQATFPNVT